MARLVNEMAINAPVGKIWSILTNLEALERYDPTVKSSKLVSSETTGKGAKRRVIMVDGKNWFEEHVTVCETNNALTYQLTDCSFPIRGLQHSYSFQESDGGTKVTQVMEYTVKYGILGRFLDNLMIRKQSDNGVKKFFAGLKIFAETE